MPFDAATYDRREVIIQIANNLGAGMNLSTFDERVALQEIADLTAALPGTYASLVESANIVAGSGAAQTLPAPTAYGATQVTLTASCTFTMPAVSAAGKTLSFAVRLIQGGSGSYVPTFTGAAWPYGSAPAWSTAVGAVDLVVFTSVHGSAWMGSALIGLA